MIHAGVHVRPATQDDLSAINDIYNHYIQDPKVLERESVDAALHAPDQLLEGIDVAASGPADEVARGQHGRAGAVTHRQCLHGRPRMHQT